jgi:hypothetical protein
MIANSTMSNEIMNDETYLGDGLYASFDGYQITLRAPREHGDHYVALEPEVYQSLLEYVERLKTERLPHEPAHMS